MVQMQELPRVLSDAEWLAQGQDTYNKKVRAFVEMEANIGKHVVFNIETGEYEIDSNALAATERALARWPEPLLFGTRVGSASEFKL